jgi:hypothetical protein
MEGFRLRGKIMEREILCSVIKVWCSFPAWTISAGPTLQWVFIRLSKRSLDDPLIKVCRSNPSFLLNVSLVCQRIFNRTTQYCQPYAQDRRCTYNVTLWPIGVSIIPVEKAIVITFSGVCVCSFGYSICNAHAPYWHVSCLAPQKKN